MNSGFLDALKAQGFLHPKLPTELGKFIRFPGIGDNSGEDGWATLVSDGIIVYGDWSCLGKRLWRIRNTPLTKEEKEDIASAVREARAIQDGLQREAAVKAKDLYDSSQAASVGHPYLSRKGIDPHNARVSSNGDLLIPAYDGTGRIVALEKVVRTQDGFAKRWTKNGKRRGTFCPIGDIQRSDLILIAEGFATAATLFEATGVPSVSAFGAGNICPAIAELKKAYPGKRLIVCPDDDDAGKEAANKAERLMGCPAVSPDFGGLEQNGGNDFNDLLHALGEDWQALKGRVTASLDSLLKEAEVPEPPPAGYVVDDGGVFQVVDGERFFVSKPIYVTGLAKAVSGDGYALVVAFKTVDGVDERRIIPMKKFSSRDGSTVLEAIFDAGFPLVVGKQRTRLLDYLAKSNPAARYVTTSKTGWLDGSFVLPDTIVGGGNILFSGGEGEGFMVGGTIEGWKNGIAAMAAGNSRLVFAISAAFSAPLLAPLGMQPTGFHFFGPSSTGKTTILLAACSVFGDGRIMRTWSATANGLEGLAAARNDALFCIDEISQCDAKTAYETAYRLGNGTQKGRADRFGNPRPAARWRLIFLSSGEISFRQHIESGGLRHKAGQSVRIIDIPAVCGDRSGAFERVGGGTVEANDKSKRFADALRVAANENFGHPARAFIERLVKNGATGEFDSETKARVKMIADDILGGREIGAQARRGLDYFALAAFAGELATGYGLTGWGTSEAARAARICFDAWLGERGAEDQEGRDVVESVAAFIHKNKDGRFANGDFSGGGSVRNLAGYFFTMGKKTEYCFTAEGFREAVGEATIKYAAKILQEHRLLITEGGRLQARRVPKSLGRQVWLYVVSDDVLDAGEKNGV